MKNYLKNLTIPISILAVMLVAYGLQLHQLGFYWDDWLFVYRYRVEGILGTIFYGDARRYQAYALAPGFIFAGSSVLRWHIYSLLLRWVMALAMRWNLHLIWPDRRWQADLMALLFSVYPAFTQHSMAVTYSTHYMVYLWYLVSFALMIQAIRSPRYIWPLSLGALFAQTMHLFQFEYYFGLELLRLPVLWIVLNGGWTLVNKKVLKQTLLRYLPYFIIVVVYALWRTGLLAGTTFKTYGHITFFQALAADPQLALMDALGRGLRDLLYVLVTSWYQTLNVKMVDFTKVFDIGTFWLAFLVAAIVWWFWRAGTNDNNGKLEGKDQFQVINFAALALVFALLPTWYAGREISIGVYSDRFSLAALFGASVLFVAVIEWLTGMEKKRTLPVVLILVALAAGFQARMTNDYRWDWQQQKHAYWNLFWRAPNITPDTTLIINGNISPTVNGYVLTYAFNELYQTKPHRYKLPLWVDRYSGSPVEKNRKDFLAGIRTYKKYSGRYYMEIEYPYTVAMYYEYGQCLKLLNERDAGNKYIVGNFRKSAYASNLDRILPDPALGYPARQIFGDEPINDWCYYYEKAELAAQYQDWQGVLDLAQLATEARISSKNPSEYLVFIEGFARQSEWKKAADLTLKVYKMEPANIKDQICALWMWLGNDLDSPLYLQTSETVLKQVGCSEQ